MAPPVERRKAPFPSLTTTWHSEPYAAIDPTRPELSVWQGKVVVVTGGGGAIGRAETLAFAQAGCSKLAVLGRREGPLYETKTIVEHEVPGTQVLVVSADLSNAKSTSDALQTVAERLGKVDVLCANAGYLAQFSPVGEADAEDWWTGFEINVKGAFNLARAVLPVAADAGVVVVETSSCVVHIPGLQRASSYVASKLATTKIWEIVAAENRHKEKGAVEVVHMHPGVVTSELNIKSGVTATDSAHLAGQFAVWAVSPEAKKFRGKYLWCNWDVPELKRREEELTQPNQLSITLNGWPFGMTAETMDPLAFKG